MRWIKMSIDRNTGDILVIKYMSSLSVPSVSA